MRMLCKEMHSSPLTWAIIHQVNDGGIIHAEISLSDHIPESRILGLDDRQPILGGSITWIMHDRVIIIGNSSVVHVVLDSEFTLKAILDVVQVDGDVIVAIWPVLLVVEPDGVTYLVLY